MNQRNLILLTYLSFSLFFFTSLYIFITYDFAPEILFPITSIKKEINNTKQIKYILYWNKLQGNQDWFWKLGNDSFKNCPKETSCYITYNKNLMEITKFNAIIFYSVKTSDWRIPRKRGFDQKYIYFAMHNPIIHESMCKNNFYNWTMSYREDSDIRILQAFVKKKYTAYNYPIESFKNRKLVAWFCDICDINSTKIRDNYLKKLQQYINVDIYGRCGPLKCRPSKSQRCYTMLGEYYMFYLSFEHGICTDYISEDLFSVLQFNVIPIVLGGADYMSITPPNSIINAMDFKTPKKLAQFLLHLSNDTEKYMKYFDWKRDYVIKWNKISLCKLCDMLHEPLVYSTYNEMEQWVNGNNGNSCFIPWNVKNKLVASSDEGFCSIRIV